MLNAAVGVGRANGRLARHRYGTGVWSAAIMQAMIEGEDSASSEPTGGVCRMPVNQLERLVAWGDLLATSLARQSDLAGSTLVRLWVRQ